jgi:hypothetical protein
MRVVVIIGIILFSVISASASHIVGGEFELIHLSGNSYRLNLILYFDELFGNQGAKDPFADVRIFRKRDNAIMFNAIRLQQNSISNVNYTQPECSNGEIVTSRIVYSNTITLSDAQFNDPMGYYISWERCCRNYGILNIFSEDPAFSNRTAGQTFYLEFPPVVKDGEPFINSSPKLFPPLNDYACPNKNYYVDFAGTDDDGDSLVYSLVTPLNTLTPDALPPGGLPRPGPYPEVTWRPGYGLNSITKGTPDLRISADGFLSVTPPNIGQGLYVFAVKCEEFRNGVKIGEVRRDFQMLVVAACPVAAPPQIVGRKKGMPSYSLANQPLSVSFSNTVSDADRCVEVQVSDADSQKAEDNFQEKVRIRIFPLNFKNNTRYLNDLLPAISTATLVNGSVADFTICFPECSYIPNGTYQIGIIAYDDACSLPLSDTLRVTVYVEPPENSPPKFITPNQVITINEGDPLITIPIEAIDTDLDKLDVFFITDGFALANTGMTLGLDASQNGLVTGSFTWDSRCDVFDFTKKAEFKLQVFVEDRDRCLVTNRDTLTFDLKIILPGNSDPLISSNLQQANEKRINVTRKIFESLQFTVNGSDADNDFLVLGLTGKGFNPAALGITFPGAQGIGTVTSPFQWNLTCDINLNTKSVYELEFIVVDNANKCRFYKADTLQVVLTILPPDNLPPELLIESMNEVQPISNGALTATLGDEIRLKLTGLDYDVSPQDLVSIEFVSVNGNTLSRGYSFSRAQGIGRAEGYFTWNPDCSIFQNGVYSNDYVFTFTARDNRCFTGANDTQQISITIKDVENDAADFLPPNIITPDGDGKNDYFAMVQLIPPDEYVSILPKDNCIGSFVNIRIYDRWGSQVFVSSDRDFRWFAEGAAAGVYFYFLTYTHKQYKGSVSVKF